MNLFDYNAKNLLNETSPLASRMRPETFDDFVGQSEIIGPKSPLRRSIGNGTLPSLILWGPPGSGKTTLASILAQSTSAKFINLSAVTSGVSDLRQAIAESQNNLSMHNLRTVLFIDEIHRLNRVVEEVLYPAMEDFFVTWVIDKGLKARSMNLSLKPFTMIVATSRYGMLIAHLRDRFGSIHRLDFYNSPEMAQIIERSSRILEVESESEGIKHIAVRSRGTPRVANRLLRRVRDYAQVMADNVITESVSLNALEDLTIDELGLDRTDINVLKCIIEYIEVGPVG